jgi:hypothetical protein
MGRMAKFSFTNFIAFCLGAAVTIILIVADKAGKLMAPWLFILLLVAAGFTLALPLNLPWVKDAVPTPLKVSRIAFMICLVGVVYAVIAMWLSGPAVPQETRSDGLLPPLPVEIEPKEDVLYPSSQEAVLDKENRQIIERNIRICGVEIRNTGYAVVRGITVTLESIEPDDPMRRDLILHQSGDGEDFHFTKRDAVTGQKLKDSFDLQPKDSGRDVQGIDVVYSHPWYPRTAYIQHIRERRDEDIRPGHNTLVIKASADGFSEKRKKFEMQYDPLTGHLAFREQREGQQPLAIPESLMRLPLLNILPVRKLSPRTQLRVNYSWLNSGPDNMYDVYAIARIYVKEAAKLEIEQRIQCDKTGKFFEAEARSEIRDYCKRDARIKVEPTVAPNATFSRSVSFSWRENDVKGIRERTRILYLVTWLGWRDAKGRIDYAQECRWLSYTDKLDDWRQCRY